MNKIKNNKNYLISGIMILGLLFMVGCSPVSNEADLSNLDQADVLPENTQDDNDPSNALMEEEMEDHEETDITANLQGDGTLSAEEIEGLLFMREEEKLAQDVYLYLYDLWGLNQFRNIARAETTHTEAVRTLLELYDIEDPVTSDILGVFENPVLQDLYDQLIAQGSQSLEDAILVGIAIEEIDILDLEEYLAQTDNPDLIQVYTNLLNGSFNHLRAFVGSLENRTGTTYLPQFLDQESYDAILTSTSGHGGNASEDGDCIQDQETP